MKRSLTSALVLVVLVVVGLLLLTVNWSAGSRLGPVSSDALTPGATPSIAATLTYSDYQTLTAGDIWAIPTPVHTPVIPTEWPFLPKPTYPTSTPRPTPTLLPDMGVRMEMARELEISRLDAASQPATSLRVVSPDSDGMALVGAITIKEDIDRVVVIDMVSGDMQVLYEGEAQPREPRISENHVVWTTLGSLHICNLDSGQSEQKDFGAVRFARISGDMVVWQGTGDIEGYNLSTRERYSVANDPDVVESLPLISGEWVVYLTPTGSFNAAHLWAVNIRTQERIYIAEIPLWYRDEQYLDSVHAIDIPWVIWASESALNLYNLNSQEVYTVPVEFCDYTRLNPSGEMIIEHRKPSHLAISENTIIFSCGQWMGYDIEHRVLFSLPIRSSEITKGNFAGWDISGDRLVWVLTEDAFGTQERSHIYTAQIERSP